ncbi:acyl-CoA synthetase, partial [Streptosporangium subroseum]|uniref:AMP-binding enzyme n=1 Tax=Streptosporangium subroseum TaxID=106412 RepID=UPI00349279A7
AESMGDLVGHPNPDQPHQALALCLAPSGRSETKATTEDLIGWTRARVGRVKYPREIYFTDSIPVTSVLKLDRKALRARLTG